MFSLLVGLGIALTILMIKNPCGRGCGVRRRGDSTLGEDTIVINLTFIFILITLVSTLIVGAARRSHP